VSLGLILVIILVIFLLGGFSGRFGGYGYGFGHGGVSVIGLILIVIVILMLLGRVWLDGRVNFLGFSRLQRSDAEKGTITEMKKALGHWQAKARAMNFASAFVWLMSAGVLALAALPAREQIPRSAEAANAASAKSEIKRERDDAGQRRRIRVVLSSPYATHADAIQEPPKVVDKLAVSALPDLRDVAARAEARSSYPSKVAPLAPRSRPLVGGRDDRRQAKARAPTLKRADAGLEPVSADKSNRRSYRMVTLDERP
jgi:uncharacterized protein DUF3309